MYRRARLPMLLSLCSRKDGFDILRGGGDYERGYR